MHRHLRRSAAAVALAVSAIAAYACKEGGDGPTDPKETAGGIANSARSDADILGLMHEASSRRASSHSRSRRTPT